jgi:predicted DNA-binding transcriptional regulator YafY
MKLDRLVSILVMLLRRERVQAKDLAEKFGVSVRTILRDVEAINLAGIPIVTYQGANGGIGIAEGYRLDRSVLTGDDMAAIITALRGVSRTMPGGKHEVLMEKIKNILPSPQLEVLDSKVNQLVIDLAPWGGNEALKGSVAAIRMAIENRREIEFKYVDPAGNRTERRVEPYSLILKGQKWYLYAWCLMRRDFRLFKLSRIREMAVLDTSYNPREVSMEHLPWENEMQMPENMISLELIFEKEMEGIIDEWFGDSMTKLADGRILAKALLPESNWLYGFILSFGTGVEVVSPPHVRTILSEIASGILKKYS